MTENESVILPEYVQHSIVLLRGQRVLLSPFLAGMYGVQPRVLIQAVTRNVERFPDDFMFQLNKEEAEYLRFHIGTSTGRGGRRHFPYAFTEQGVAMLSSVLKSPRAVQVNIEIMRAFVKLRQMLASNDELRKKLLALERKYDSQFRMVFDAIRELMEPEDPPAKKPVGFQTEQEEKARPKEGAERRRPSRKL